MKTFRSLIQIIAILAMLMTTLTTHAHEGVHAAGQAHLGAHHMSFMEVSLFLSAMVAVAFLAYKVVKDRR